jgi:hypothetical protein
MGDSPGNTPTEKLHPLIEPRFVGALGVAAFGGGVGLALMLARILLIWGLAISLLCAAAVIWIYAEHFRAAYRALKRREPYKSAAKGAGCRHNHAGFFGANFFQCIFFNVKGGDESEQADHGL